MRALIGILFLISSWNFSLNAQEAILTLDSTKFLIGDWIKVHLQVNTPKESQLEFPDIFKKWSDFEIIDISKIDTFLQEDVQSLTYQVTLSKYDTGFFPLPPLTYYSILDNEVRDSFSTQASLIEISGIPIDTANAELKAIKDIIPEKITWKEIVKRFFWIPLVLLLLVVLYILYKKRKPKETNEVVQKISNIPAHTTALEQLEELKIKRLWQSGEIKTYYIELSDIVRTYIENRFNSPALESTSDEILSNLKRKNITREQLENLSFMLKTADLAKFAKFNPLSEENEQTFEIAKDFIINTKVEDKPLEDA